MAVRVFVSGVGGEQGSRVAERAEHESWVGEIAGCDLDPPRVRLRRTLFHRISPEDRERITAVIRSFDPHVLLHLGVYEPGARSTPVEAAARTVMMASSVLDAARACPSLEAIVVRSGIEVYGRRRGRPLRPDESVAPEPSSGFGRSLRAVEVHAARLGRERSIPVTLLRCAPVVGAHVPSPLGRILRQPLVPVSLVANPPFSLLAYEDAAAAVLAAAVRRPDGPVNVVGAGAVSPWRVARLGGRVPVPIVGLQWSVARLLAELAGAPVPDHVVELLCRGRVADGAAAADLLGVAPATSTLGALKALHEWEGVVHLRRVAA